MSEHEALSLACLSGDLELLCRLHDREPDAALLAVLRATPAARWFVLRVDGGAVSEACQLLDRALAALPQPPSDGALDELAADYADLYLNFAQRLAPNESYWRDDDHLERQAPMFEVRRWYGFYGLAVRDWRMRADDHLVHELEFLTALLNTPQMSAWLDAGRFLDRHLLLWSREFLRGVARRAATPFYAAIAVLTEAYLDALRGALEGLTGETRVALEVAGAARDVIPGEQSSQSYLPGCGPGW